VEQDESRHHRVERAIAERELNRVSDEQGEGARAKGHHGLGPIETDDHRLGRGIAQVRRQRSDPTPQIEDAAGVPERGLVGQPSS